MAELVSRVLNYSIKKPNGSPLADEEIRFTIKEVAPGENFIASYTEVIGRTDDTGNGSVTLYTYKNSFINYYASWDGSGGDLEFTLADEQGDAILQHLLQQAAQSEDLRFLIATLNSLGVIKPDGVTLSIADNGTLSVIGGGASGPAGGVLAGNYPNPAFAVNMAEQSELDAGILFAKNRLNHIGTQLAATISNFAATVRATLLTGLEAEAPESINETDSLLIALGKLQAQIETVSGASSPISLFSNGANETPLTIKAAVSQIDNLFETVNAAGGLLAYLTAGGFFSAKRILVNGSSQIFDPGDGRIIYNHDRIPFVQFHFADKFAFNNNAGDNVATVNNAGTFDTLGDVKCGVLYLNDGTRKQVKIAAAASGKKFLYVDE